MTLATRLFASTSLLVGAAVVGSIVAADAALRRHLEAEVADGLEREGRLVATLLPSDSSAWSEFARAVGGRLRRRVTLIDAAGRVRGDSEFERAALTRLENHAGRPEVRAALDTGRGRAWRVSASTNAREMYVAVRGGGGSGGIAVVRVSASLALVDARVHALQRSVAGVGLVALLLAALAAWLLGRALARPLVALGAAARDIAAGRPARFPQLPVPELARHADALRAMEEELERRFGALRREREESRTLLEALSDGVLAADAHGAIASCNAAARRLLGYRAAEPLPPLDELFHDQPARAMMREALTGGLVGPNEIELQGRSVRVSSRPLPDGGTVIVLNDLTDLRRLETVRRDFVANVSHELKTPLTAIAGFAETLATEAPGDSDTGGFARTILQNARRMQRLVDDLLDLSRIESGGWRPERRPVDVEAAARDAWAPFADRAAAGGVTFEVVVAPEAHTLAADPAALDQIFTNLVGNALRHTPAGGHIRVTGEPGPREGWVTVRVADSGSGIPAEHVPRIFERFYRVDSGRAREQGGTGLGLAIVKHLVEAHGGRVEAESTLGRGTTIRLWFPGPLAPVTNP